MSLFKWKDDFSVNIKEIDRQHMMLIDTLNELFDAMRSGEVRETIGGILKSMIDYTYLHFSTEEKLMQTHGFPGYTEHKTAHDEFVAKVTEFRDKHKQGKVMLSIEVMNFLKDWLSKHINGMDKKYSAHLNERGVV